MTIQYLWTNDTARKNFSKLLSNVKAEFEKLFQALNISRVSINSTWRDGDAGTHGKGKALDIHEVIINKQSIVFTVRVKSYSKEKDIEFFNLCKNALQGKLLQYISPAVVYLPTSPVKANRQRANKYSNLSNSEQLKIIGQLETKYRGDLDAQHLHHLHISIEPSGLNDFPKQKMRSGSSVSLIVLSLVTATLLFLNTPKGKKIWHQTQDFISTTI